MRYKRGRRVKFLSQLVDIRARRLRVVPMVFDVSVAPRGAAIGRCRLYQSWLLDVTALCGHAPQWVLGWVQSVYGLAAKGALNLHALRLREARSASCLDSNSSTAA